MNSEERKEIKEIISDIMTGVNARIEAKYDIIDIKLDAISTHLANINGKVQKHEKTINDALKERVGNRQKQDSYFKEIDENNKKIRILEDSNLSQRSVKKFIGVMFVSGIALGAFVVGLIEFLIKVKG